jgi:transcriptional regulator with XRE-family HTH domain
VDSYIDKRQFYLTFGVAVREARESLNLDIIELGRDTGISPAKLRKIETAGVQIRLSTVNKLAARLGISESVIERLLQVARIKYIDEMMTMIWSTSSVAEDADASNA